ncbi:U-box domain-containing protein 15 [Euphorbia lathyris]|uniref:U-box domain-containing protein 15 n=1 Tax=Euphorbia lathyris TaxID=212925 RepID=UPI00331369AA
MDGPEEDGNGEIEAEIGTPESTPITRGEEESDIVDEISKLIEYAAQLGDYRRIHRKECYCLVRRMKLLLPFLEEIRDLNRPISDNGVTFLSNLRKTFISANKLLRVCNEGSKIDLAVGSEAVMVRFRLINESLHQALDSVPYDELGISDEIQEQVELMRTQLKRSKGRTDTQDMELTMDMMVVLSKDDDRNADGAIIKRLAQKLELHTVEDLNNETIAVRNLVREKGGTGAQNLDQIVDLLNKFKQIVGMEVTDVLSNPIMRKLEKSPSLIIPHEFLCPITLEIMRDPVIIASGQTYERDSIQKWFTSSHRTCPKTRQTLAHLSVASNFALKNLIVQWCEEKNFHLPPAASSVPEGSSSPVDNGEKIVSLIKDLSSHNLEVQRKAVKKIRMLSKENSRNRVSIANNGAIPPLVQILYYPDSKIQEHAVTALLNLSIDETNKRVIASEGAIPAIIEVLQHGCTEARENSAAALFSLSMLDENKITIGLSNGIPPLVKLLQHGTSRGKKDAATALFNLSLNHLNKGRAIEAGIVTPLLQLLKDKNLGMVDEALSILLLLSSHPEGRCEIGQLSFIEILVEFMEQGTPKNKECAASVLLELASNNSSFILAALQFGVYEHLVEITNSGTDRAQRKANALLQLMTKTEQI